MNRIMFVAGMLTALTSALLLVLVGELGSSPIVLGIIGILLVGASKFHIMKT